MEARVKAGLWVSMAIRMADISGHSAVVLRKGDPDSGGVLCVLYSRAGLCVLAQTRDGDGNAAWIRGTGPAAVDQPTADAYVERAVKRDPDLWVVEFDVPDLVPPFEARIL